jgi:hypothetical protein
MSQKCNAAANCGAHFFNQSSISLKCNRVSLTIMHAIPGERRNAWMTSTPWGDTMRLHLLSIRALKILSAAVFCIAMAPAPSHAASEADAQRLCTGDVMRLCSSEIPDRGRIIACMQRQKANLSAGCRSVFGRPTARSASARRSDDD